MTEYIQKQPPHVYKKQLPFRLRILQSTKVTVIRSQTTLDKLSRDYKSKINHLGMKALKDRPLTHGHTEVDRFWVTEGTHTLTNCKV